MTKSAHILMIDPLFYDVSYRINPWMKPDQWANNSGKLKVDARTSFMALCDKLEEIGCKVSVFGGVYGLPDMVFPANAAIVLGGRVLLSRFRNTQRQGEEKHFNTIFRALKDRNIVNSVDYLPEGIIQEGAGDCIWDSTRDHFWAGWGQRSTKESTAVIADHFERYVEPLELITESSYHLDVCFSVLTDGEVVYYPGAFSKESQARIKELVNPDLLIEATEEDLEMFSINAINVGGDIVMNNCSDRLQGLLTDRGYKLHLVDMSPFMLSGGAAFCMTLRLDR